VATIFTHVLVPVAVALVARGSSAPVSGRLLAAAMFATVLPDFDVIAFLYGIPYDHILGHRGVTHSLGFALGIGLLGALAAEGLKASRTAAFFMLAGATASHAFLDAFTNGGLGVAALWPLSDVRYFMPWQPVEVSPIGVSAFFTARGALVLLSELYWIVAPLAVLAVAGRFITKSKT